MTTVQERLFYRIWKNSGDIYDYFMLAKRIYPVLTFYEWDKQWQSHVISHDDKKESLRQFQSAVFLAGGDWNKIF